MSDNAESVRVTRGSRKRAREDRKAARAASARVSQLPFGALVNNYSPLSPLTEEQLEVIHKASLELLRDGELNRSSQRVADLLDELIADNQERLRNSGIKLRVELEAPSLAVQVDRPLYLTALSAITDNAIEALPDGGELEIRVRRLGPNYLEIRFEDLNQTYSFVATLPRKTF